MQQKTPIQQRKHFFFVNIQIYNDLIENSNTVTNTINIINEIANIDRVFLIRECICTHSFYRAVIQIITRKIHVYHNKH